MDAYPHHAPGYLHGTIVRRRQATALARDLQVEQDRAPAVLPDHPRLARPPPDQLRRHREHHRRRHHRNRADRHRRPGRQQVPHRDQDQRQQAKTSKTPLTRHDWHGEWNYTLLTAPRPAPEPDPEPAARPGRCSSDLLNRPALTGLARRPRRPRRRAGDPVPRPPRAAPLPPARTRPPARRGRRGGAPQARPHRPPARHPDAPAPEPAPRSSPPCSAPTHHHQQRHRATARLLAGQPQPPAAPPPGIRLRTLDDLRDYAARHGITITGRHRPPHAPRR